MIQRSRHCHIISVVSTTGSVVGSRAEIWNQGIVQTPWPKAQLLPLVTDAGKLNYTDSLCRVPSLSVGSKLHLTPSLFSASMLAAYT